MLLSENGSQSAWVRAPDLVPELPPSPCETCQVRKSNFCGALFGDRDDWAAFRGEHRSTAARQTVYRAGEATEGVLLICDGWAVRFVQLPNGKRQILSVLLPGDLASPTAIGERQFAFSIQAVTKVRYCYLPFADVRARIQHDPALFEAWIRLTTTAQRDADRRLVDLGQRTAQERIAALVVHVMARFEERGELHDDRFPFPLSQQQIADCTGLTPVHACRVLGLLRRNGICNVGHGAVKILERAELQRLAALR
ncbi:MAG TPA: Crp/Fnr family transcriptional regulator [Steroidobacteraceae bacterium]|jgi:CRP-like cAMP-binding protein|nr:Crp/Fnr family transcriptional regulator [Steroidobacteraceae bacterium]